MGKQVRDPAWTARQERGQKAGHKGSLLLCLRHSVPYVVRLHLHKQNVCLLMTRSAAWLYTHLVASNHSWARHAKVVLDTPLGGALPSHWPWMVGPMAPAHKVESLAE